MRIYALVLTILMLVIQYPLWLGKGGWFRVWQLREQVQMQSTHNLALKQRNDALEADVKDLQDGTDAVEERARYELGMIKSDETFVQLIENATSTLPSSSP